MKDSPSPSDFLESLTNPDLLDKLSEHFNTDTESIERIIDSLSDQYPSEKTDETTEKILKVDGASRGNPGPAGGGAVLLNQDENIERQKKEFFGNAVTNNEAEYRALLLGLSIVPRESDSVIIRMDSELAIKQLQGNYQVKSERLRPYYERAQNRLDELKSIILEHIPREDNETADQLANDAIDQHQRRESIS